MKTRKQKPMAVYWINMDRSKERRENMLNVLKDSAFDGMTKHRIEAFDGTNPTTEKKMRTMIDMTDKATVKEYACLLSHLKTILLFSKSNYEYALILEDDASIEYKPFWKKTFMECIKKAPSDWEIVQLCFFGHKLPTQLYSSKHHYSTTAYIIRKTAAKKLIKQMQPLFTLDNTLIPVSDVYIYKVLKTYVYRYPFFTFENKDTTIFDKKELIGRNKSKQTLKKLLE
jgi:GR25 family glycosyltransferase involved in LPS biosynthesis